MEWRESTGHERKPGTFLHSRIAKERWVPALSELAPVIAEICSDVAHNEYVLPAQRFRDPGVNPRTTGLSPHALVGTSALATGRQARRANAGPARDGCWACRVRAPNRMYVPGVIGRPANPVEAPTGIEPVSTALQAAA
jgi:hypothetical protein